ncbi:PorT family protein [Flavobacterium zepuense]|uniref:PorT family protein n=1 Tax=Flavobacterium zepuense TaxID=2593302 RepID=A0A552V2L1_9FLAO|nr:porin family protein [Flavobacterium zepuense]TRW24705.1 PorT family protein [Flavobacterium zepuense]
MKKIILSAAMLLAIGFTAKAQETKLGVKAGVNFANFTGDVEGSKSRTGFNAGFVAEFKLSENFSIQPELLYSQQGTRFEESGSVSGISYRLEEKGKFDYLALPVVAKYYIIEGLSLHAGPQVSYLLKADVESTGSASTGESYSETLDLKDYSNKVDFALVGGAGYDLPIGVFFEARYVAGISKIGKDGDSKVRNGVFQLSVGYKF